MDEPGFCQERWKFPEVAAQAQSFYLGVATQRSPGHTGQGREVVQKEGGACAQKWVGTAQKLKTLPCSWVSPDQSQADSR